MSTEHFNLSILLVLLFSLLIITGNIYSKYEFHASVHILEVLVEYSCKVFNSRWFRQIYYNGVYTQMHSKVYLLCHNSLRS